MVLQHAHPFFAASLPRLDFARIAAGAGAIALNVVVLLLLLIPAGLPDIGPQAPPRIIVVPIAEKTPPPPVPVPIVQPAPTVAPSTPAPVRPDIVQPVVEQIVVEHGSLPAEQAATPPVETGVGNIAPSAGPIAGMRLEYIDAPSPRYPRDALIAGLQGTVMLQVLVDVDGRPLQVDIQRSSGHRVLDEAARRQVLRHWLFRPATADGRPVQAVGIVPIAFNLD
jgi:protein TonB